MLRNRVRTMPVCPLVYTCWLKKSHPNSWIKRRRPCRDSQTSVEDQTCWCRAGSSSTAFRKKTAQGQCRRPRGLQVKFNRVPDGEGSEEDLGGMLSSMRVPEQVAEKVADEVWEVSVQIAEKVPGKGSVKGLGEPGSRRFRRRFWRRFRKVLVRPGSAAVGDTTEACLD